jgi:hypothetical protein
MKNKSWKDFVAECRRDGSKSLKGSGRDLEEMEKTIAA